MNKHSSLIDAMREVKTLLPKLREKYSINDSVYFVSYRDDFYFVAYGYEGKTKIEALIENRFYEYGWDRGIEEHGKDYKVFEYVTVARGQQLEFTFFKAKRSLLDKNIVRRIVEVAGEPLVSYALQ